MTRIRRASKEIEHIPLADGDWVDLRVLNFGDRQEIMAALLDPDTNEQTRDRIREANVVEMTLAIVAWGGPGFGCTCPGGCRCEPKPPHANDCHVWAINAETIEALDETGDILLRLIDAKQDRARDGKDPFVLSRPTSPSSGGGAEATDDSRHTSTSGTSSASGTSTSERPSD